MCKFLKKKISSNLASSTKIVAREEIPIETIKVELPIPEKSQTVVTFHVEQSEVKQPDRVKKDSYDIDSQFILDQEMGGRSYYEKKLQSPTWPGASSGVTFGSGFDAGYNTVEEIKNSWKGYIPDHDIDRLTRYAGITGEKAKNLPSEVQDIKVPYDVAIKHFKEKILSRFIKQTEEAFGSIKGLSQGQQTALVSLVFNRGPSLVGKKRVEMKSISDAMKKGEYAKIPGLIRDMKRLWSLKGLLRRRDEEASLFASGINPNDREQTA